MTPKQTSKQLGISPQQVRWLIRKGYMQANRIETPGWGSGFVYDVTPQQLSQYVASPRDGRGHVLPAK